MTAEHFTKAEQALLFDGKSVIKDEKTYRLVTVFSDIEMNDQGTCIIPSRQVIVEGGVA